VRGWRTLCGTVEIEAEPLREGVFRVTVEITNTTSWEERIGIARSGRPSSRRTRRLSWREGSLSR
jgi:hypothetical protein